MCQLALEFVQGLFTEIEFGGVVIRKIALHNMVGVKTFTPTKVRNFFDIYKRNTKKSEIRRIIVSL